MSRKDSLNISLRRRLISGGTWAFAGKVASALINLLISGLLTRLLSPEDVGTYFLIFSIAMAGATFAQLGLNQLAVRLIAEATAKNEAGQIRPLVLRILAITTVSTLTLALLLYNVLGEWLANTVFNSTTMAQLVGLAALWLTGLATQSIIAECFRGLHEIRRATLFQGLASSTIFVTLLAFYKFTLGQATLSVVIGFVIFATAINILVAGITLYRRLQIIAGPTQTNYHTSELLNQTWPLFITSITLFTLSQASLWILGMFSIHDDVALYGAAVRLINLVAMPLMIANAVLPPIIAELAVQGEKLRLQRILRTTASLTGIPALLVCICFIIFPGEFLSIVFGDFYTHATNILVILAAGQIINVWAGSCGLTLMMTGHQQTMMKITLVCGLLTVSLSLAVVRDFGSTGIAAVSATVLFIQNALMLFYAHRTVGVWTHATFSPMYLKANLTRS